MKTKQVSEIQISYYPSVLEDVRLESSQKSFELLLNEGTWLLFSDRLKLEY